MIRLGSVNSSENTSDKMNEHHEKVEELFQNQKYILEAVANLNERLAKIEEKIDNQNVDEVKEILNSQAIIDKIIVKNSDDILQIQKVKEENADILKGLKERIDILDDEAKEIIREKKETYRCRYHNRGYCKNKGLCLFFHPTEICPAFLRDGKCLLINCSSRHPKTCKFWKRGYCYRGEECAFNHDNHEDSSELESQTCNNCMGSTLQTYFCEFCCSNFCTNCTLREAHDENYDKITNIISCKQIHLQTQNTNDIEDDEEVDMVTVDDVDEKSVTVEKCVCERSSSKENFKCDDCEKYFCKDCPTGPVGLNCIECYMNSSLVLSSTPVKKY